MTEQQKLSTDIGLKAVSGTGDRVQVRSLRALQQSGGSTFESFGQLREEILFQISRLENLWKRACEPSTLEQRGSPVRVTSESALSELLDETRRLFSGSRVEIGAFGEVKKGKSSLVNGLVGRVVTAVAAPPETAVPVIIERSDRDYGRLYLGGGEPELVTVDEALQEMTQRGQRKRARAGKAPVTKVSIGAASTWLPPNVVLVDTPGLNDPSVDTDYDKFALAELDRVNAAIFVFCYPNGPGSQEIKLLKSLGKHGVDKVFLAYNFWPDAWSDEQTRVQLVDYLRDLVCGVSNQEALVDPEDVRIYPINLKKVSDWLANGSEEQLATSGFLELRSDLEKFLAGGVLSRSLAGASKRLIGVAKMINETLESRTRLINNPTAITDVKRNLEEMISRSDRKLVEIRNRAQTSLDALGSELRNLVKDPFDVALLRAMGTRDRAALQAISPQLVQDANTAMSRVASTWSTRLLDIVADCRAQLAASLEVQGWGFTGSAGQLERLSLEGMSEVTVLDRTEAVDHTAKGAIAGGLVGALVAATGAGLSIATGGLAAPLIGLLFGASAGGLMGGLVSDPGRGAEVSVQEFNDLVGKIRSQQTKVMSDVDRLVNQGTRDLFDALTEARKRAVSDVQSELTEVNRILGDVDIKSSALRSIEDIRLELGRIVG